METFTPEERAILGRVNGAIPSYTRGVDAILHEAKVRIAVLARLLVEKKIVTEAKLSELEDGMLTPRMRRVSSQFSGKMDPELDTAETELERTMRELGLLIDENSD